MTTPAYFICTLCMCTLLLVSCSNEPEDKQDRMEDNIQSVQEDIREVDTSDMEEFEKDRQDILKQLRDLRADINDDLSDAELKLVEEDQQEDDRINNERLHKELQQQRTLVDRQIETVENANMNDWQNVRSGSQDALTEADLFYTREDLDRRRRDVGTTGGSGVYPSSEQGDGTVNTDRDLNLDDAGEERK